ncbi:glycosyl transferase [Longimonas halophila]|uniref:Glycosyl transferase n=1 Tax=Longimonas halophila TaxID=1469170 RepID=A0A2H3NQA9_9BACT|nr:glycosyltransferase family 2 protein [Longimonas halophila]PEN09262.1 glycosyl transferase [Longimonas halophila]
MSAFSSPAPSASSVPRVSIGLPVYNGAEYLEAAIQSVLNQTFTDFEFIICDNASTDATEAICKSAADRDARVRYIRHPENLGAARNYNSTLAAARAPYFRWTCHDDLLQPTCLEACVDMLDAHPAASVVYTGTQVINEDSMPRESPNWIHDVHLVDPDPATRFAGFLDAYCWGGDSGPLFGLMRTNLLRATMQHGNFPSADLILIGELALWGPIYQIPEPLFVSRLHDANSTRSNDMQIAAIWKWFDPRQQQTLHWLEWRWLYELYRAIWRAPLTRVQRCRCLAVFMRRYVAPHARHCLKEVFYMALARTGMQRASPPPRVMGLRTRYSLF